jgi:hypothetical protein
MATAGADGRLLWLMLSRPGWELASVSTTSAMAVRRPLQLVGKLAGPGWINAVAAGQLIQMLDQNINRRFMVNTGVSNSILLHQSSLPVMGPKLIDPGRQPIPCWGESLVQLCFQDQVFFGNFF